MNRAGNERTGNRMLNIPVKGGAELTEATMAAINSDGYAVEATASAGLLIAGCVQRYCDNRNGADGEQTVSVKRGTFVWENDGTIKETDILKKCYIKDEKTVTITADHPECQQLRTMQAHSSPICRLHISQAAEA